MANSLKVGRGDLISGKILAGELHDWLKAHEASHENLKPIDPGGRVKFNWPPPSACYGFHLASQDWSKSILIQIDGLSLTLEVAETQRGVFGRSHEIWLDAMGKTVDQMISEFKRRAKPLFCRSVAISQVLEQPPVYHWNFHELDPLSLLKLLFCSDRDVANNSRVEIESRNPKIDFTPALTAILNYRAHPYLRTAQWCALDIFEDLPSFCKDEHETQDAIQAIRNLLWDAKDDYARVVYKAGVVLGGHLPSQIGGPVLLECLNSPSRIGRRSAIHALFHVVEWAPETQTEVVESLRKHSEIETDPELRRFSILMADDIAGNQTDSVPEPIFPEDYS